jgi:transitional endoplasmic reticulum ATPase
MQTMIERIEGQKIQLPQAMSIKVAVDTLLKQAEFEETTIEIIQSFPVYPWDGAVALMEVLKQRFGWVTLDGEEIKTMFGTIKNKPKLINVPTGPDTFVTVPWGQFPLVSLDNAQLCTQVQKGLFAVTAVVKRKHEDAIKAIFRDVELYLKTNSIYRGKAMRASFVDSDGDKLEIPEVKFMDVSKIDERDLVLPRAVESAISTNLFAVLEHADACRKAQIPLKRGVLLEGPYGTGKSLVATIAAKKATQNGWTYVYVSQASDLGEAVRFAKVYEPAVVFCEDIDREVQGQRTQEMDAILNVIDGIETKRSEIVVILTSNHVRNINAAMLRPGRLDAIIHMEAPDADAVRRLLLKYSRETLVVTDENRAQLETVCQRLAGQVPAAIREVVERAKLSAIKLSNGEDASITVDAVADAADSMHHQLVLLDRGKDRDDEYKEVHEQIIDRMADGLSRLLLTEEKQDVPTVDPLASLFK